MFNDYRYGINNVQKIIFNAEILCLFQTFSTSIVRHSKKNIFSMLFSAFVSSVAEPEPVEPKIFWDLEPARKINFNKHFLQSVWRMLE